LYKRGIQSLMVEGGARLLQHFIDEGLWDEARVEIAPFCLGRGVSVPQMKEENLRTELSVDSRKILNYSREM
jgi:diaminohydroxyphosphoribosylaminopyrimidine deaminase/5-amino-6-(5-phosphoribosylamino)uracil reductase